MRQILIVLCLLLTGVVSAQATPSFDCARATTPDELAICAHRNLALLDDSVAAAYAEIRAFRGPGFIANYGRVLLDERRACGADLRCIEAAQRYAIEAYKALGARSVGPLGQSFSGYGIRSLIEAWGRANGECRGTDPAMVEAACRLRDRVLAPALSAHDLCLGVYSLPFNDFQAMILVRNHWLPCVYNELTEQ
ncbi:MAG: hypothetical protein H6898_01980 [Rhodobacter sp.]|nr:hypothetical protein [Rhodobacter sp.]